MLSPRPVPAEPLVVTNGSKIVGRTSAGIPGPVSSTVIWTRAGPREPEGRWRRCARSRAAPPPGHRPLLEVVMVRPHGRKPGLGVAVDLHALDPEIGGGQGQHLLDEF